MQESRKLVLSDTHRGGDAVIYVMSRDQRAQDNHALLFAQRDAAERGVPLYVLFVLQSFPNRAREHYQFMLGGLRDVAETLSSHHIGFVLRTGDPDKVIIDVASETKAAALYFDFHPGKRARTLAKSIARSFDGSVTVVDTHNLIPAWAVSDKQEYAAHTFRRRVHKFFEHYTKLPPLLPDHPHKAATIDSLTFDQVDDWVVQNTEPASITIDAQPGPSAAHAALRDFIDNRLANYASDRNDPSLDGQSNLSPYLHYGSLSSLRIVHTIITKLDTRPFLFEEPSLFKGSDNHNAIDGMNALFEELIVRKELSDNFVLHTKDPRSLSSIAGWAAKTLKQHTDDPRDFIYTQDQWEQANTHDDAWNAAQTQLAKTGNIHGYMRMYWAKKLLEWSKSPEEALKIGIYLNDKYSVDGLDPNGYVGLLWSIGGLHDRPWTERPVFGQIRYMNAGGLKRKFDIGAYTNRWLNPKP